MPDQQPDAVTDDGDRSAGGPAHTGSAGRDDVDEWYERQRAKTREKRKRYRDKTLAYSRRYYLEHKAEASARALKRHGITADDYNAMLARQNGRCACCGTDTPGGRGRWHVDHDHACCPGDRSCGRCVRGLPDRRSPARLGRRTGARVLEGRAGLHPGPVIRTPTSTTRRTTT